MMYAMARMRLAIDMIQSTLNTYLGPLAKEGIFEELPEYIWGTDKDAVIRFKTKAYVEKTSQPAGGLTHQGSGPGESGQ